MIEPIVLQKIPPVESPAATDKEVAGNDSNIFLSLLLLLTESIGEALPQDIDARLTGILVKRDQTKAKQADIAVLNDQLADLQKQIDAITDLDKKKEKLAQIQGKQDEILTARKDLSALQNKTQMSWQQGVNPVQQMIEQGVKMGGYLVKMNTMSNRNI